MIGPLRVIILSLGIVSAAVPHPSALIARTKIHKLSAPLELHAWGVPNCPGDAPAWTHFNEKNFARNVSNCLIARSFRLSRPLEGQEQLDISVTGDYATWYPDKDQLSHNSSSCTQFWKSYYAVNGSTKCHNTRPFTCHRLWNNPGLPTS